MALGRRGKSECLVLGSATTANDYWGKVTGMTSVLGSVITRVVKSQSVRLRRGEYGEGREGNMGDKLLVGSSVKAFEESERGR